MRKSEGKGEEGEEKKIFYRGESKRRLKENFHRFSIMDPDRVADGVRPVFKPLLHPLVRESVRRRIVVSHFGPPRPAISTPRWQRRFSAGLGRLKRISCTMKYVHFPMFSFHTPIAFPTVPLVQSFQKCPRMVNTVTFIRFSNIFDRENRLFSKAHSTSVSLFPIFTSE